MAKHDHQSIEMLLLELTEWQRMNGIGPSTAPDVKSTGESNAAIEELKTKLAQIGARYHWSESSREYQLDSIDTPTDIGDALPLTFPPESGHMR